MQKLAEEGIEITALHNHLLRTAPATFYMHVRGFGDPAKLAAALHDALVLSKTPLTASSGVAPSQIELDLIPLGSKGEPGAERQRRLQLHAIENDLEIGARKANAVDTAGHLGAGFAEGLGNLTPITFNREGRGGQSSSEDQTQQPSDRGNHSCTSGLRFSPPSRDPRQPPLQTRKPDSSGGRINRLPIRRAEWRGNEAPIENFSSARQSTRLRLLKNRLRRASLSGKMEMYKGMLRPWLEKPDAMLGHAA